MSLIRSPKASSHWKTRRTSKKTSERHPSVGGPSGECAFVFGDGNIQSYARFVRWKTTLLGCDLTVQVRGLPLTQVRASWIEAGLQLRPYVKRASLVPLACDQCVVRIYELETAVQNKLQLTQRKGCQTLYRFIKKKIAFPFRIKNTRDHHLGSIC